MAHRVPIIGYSLAFEDVDVEHRRDVMIAQKAGKSASYVAEVYARAAQGLN